MKSNIDNGFRIPLGLFCKSKWQDLGVNTGVNTGGNPTKKKSLPVSKLFYKWSG